MAHALDFLPASITRKAAPRVAKASFKTLFGLPVCDFGWEQALYHVRAAIGGEGRQTVLSFLDASEVNRLSTRRGHREALARRLLLADGAAIDLAARLVTGTSFPASFRDSDFIPALTTYLSEPMRIGVLAGDSTLLAEAVAGFRRHAPWHQFLALPADADVLGNPVPLLERIAEAELDILILATDGETRDTLIEHHLRPAHASLVITGGEVLAVMAGRKARIDRRRRKRGLEWLFRLKADPKGVLVKAIGTLPAFGLHLARECLRSLDKR